MSSIYFPAKALLTATTKAVACPVCKLEVPAAAMREAARYHREIEDVLSIDVCGSCHVIFNKMYVPFAEACEGPDERHLH